MRIIKNIIIQLLYFIIGVIAGALLFYSIMEYQHDRLRLVEVPNVVGLDSKQAAFTVKNIGLSPEVIGNGKVIGTYPRVGMKVFEGRKVEIYCFNFNVERFINRLVGVSKDFAEDVLKDLGLKCYFSYIAYSKDTGRILSVYTREDRVYLLVDKGERKRYFMIMDFRGMDIEKATKQFENMGIPFQVIGNGKVVVDQSPPPGTVSDRIVLITK